MKSPLEEVGSRVDARCLASEVDKGGCAIGLDEAPSPSVLIDLDHPASPTTRSSAKCDYVFFAPKGKAGLWAVPLELKSSAVNANRASRQLQAGARIAESLVKGRSPVQFVPVVARGRKGHRRQYQELAKKRIVFRKERHAIKLIDCGTSLRLSEF